MKILHDYPSQSGSAMTRRQVREAERSGNRARSVASGPPTSPVVWEDGSGGSGDDPLSYLTQTRPQLPSYGRSAFRDRALVDDGAPVEEAPIELVPVEQAAVEQVPATKEPSSPPAEEPAADAEAASWLPAASVTQEQRLTRRQLRELRSAGGGAIVDTAAVLVAPEGALPTVLRTSQTDDAVSAPSQPVGRWSIQADVQDDAPSQPENRVPSSPGVGTGAITATALVLPSIPVPNDLMGPMASTGEVLVTGSVNLPRSLGETGSHPRLYDRSEVDYLLEASDREDAPADSAPVRAIRAVSTNTPTHGIMGLKRAYGNRLLMVLSVVAAIMAVAVVGLLAFGVGFKLF